jgi:mediator of RNA polymerase II transcription subunit 14
VLASSAGLQRAHIDVLQVTLVVPGEFEASLTLLGELPTTPWTLLNIKILVEDYDIGYGTGLVHPLQVHFIHQVAQARMSAAVEPITELYNVVHAFAQSLQLDLLFCQTSALIAQRLRNHVTIEKYVESKELVVAYWQQRTTTARTGFHRHMAMQTAGGSQFKIVVGPDSTNPSSGLKVRHVPATSDDLPDLDDAAGRLCIERLLSETVAVRCRQRLSRLQQRMESLTGQRPAMTGDAMPSLTVALLGAGDSHADELLSVAVNMFSGLVLSRVPALGPCNELRDLERHLNEGASVALLNNVIDRLRYVRFLISLFHRSI